MCVPPFGCPQESPAEEGKARGQTEKEQTSHSSDNLSDPLAEDNGAEAMMGQ